MGRDGPHSFYLFSTWSLGLVGVLLYQDIEINSRSRHMQQQSVVHTTIARLMLFLLVMLPAAARHGTWGGFPPTTGLVVMGGSQPRSKKLADRWLQQQQ
jgi:hypothetical protein